MFTAFAFVCALQYAPGIDENGCRMFKHGIEYETYEQCYESYLTYAKFPLVMAIVSNGDKNPIFVQEGCEIVDKGENL